MTQHAELTLERWARFGLEKQVLQIAIELERGRSSLRMDRLDSLRLCYERVLRLVDLTVQANSGRSLRRELLRWRDLIAELYLAPGPDADAHRAATRLLLQLHSGAAALIPDLEPG